MEKVVEFEIGGVVVGGLYLDGGVVVAAGYIPRKDEIVTINCDDDLDT